MSGTGVPVLSAATCSSASMTGAGTDACTVTLNAAAANGGFTVNLASNNSLVAVPASITVPAGSASAGFSATVSAFTTAQTATLTANAGNASQTFALQLNATVPTLTISATSLSFGSVSVNSTTTQTLTLTSTGTAAVTVSSASLTGAGFSISGATFPLTVNPNQTATLAVQFDPAAAGATTGQLTIASNSSINGTLAITLSGTGVSGTSGVNLVWAAPSSPGDAIVGYDVFRAVSGSTYYQQLGSSSSTGYLDTTAQAGQSYSYVVTSVDGSGNQSAPSAVASVLASGSGSGTATPVLTAFSCAQAAMLGSGADTCTVTLNSAATTGGFTVNLASSSASVTMPATVIVAANSTTASFSASVAAVSTTQAVSLAASAGSTPETFALQLNAAVSTLSINATSLPFGTVNLNTPATQSITLTSTGTSPVTVSAASLTGTGFSMPGAAFPITLNPNQAATLSVEFDPTTAGTASGQLTISSNSSVNGTAVVSLSGTGQSSTGGSGATSVSLSWTAPTGSDPVAGYNVYRAQAGSTAYQLLTASAVAQTNYQDTTVQSGKTYDYVVQMVDTTGVTSAPSVMAAIAIQ